MGFFTGLGKVVNQGRAEAAYINYMGDREKLKQAGYSKLPGNTDQLKAAEKFYVQGGEMDPRLAYDTADMDRGKGLAEVYLGREYGIPTNDAKGLVRLARADISNIPGPTTYNRAVNPQAAPGSVSTQIKTSGPSQAEQVAAGMSGGPSQKEIEMAQKDWRNALAAKEVEIVQRDMAPGLSKGEIVAQLNDPAVRDNQGIIDALNNDKEYLAMYNEGPYLRAGNPEGLIGEGKFKQIYEAETPGMVLAVQPEIVEWNGYSDSGRTMGPRESPGGGLHYAPQELQAEYDIMDALSKVGIAPRVAGGVTVVPGKAAGYEMQDLRQNYTEMADVVQRRNQEYQAAKDAGDEAKIGQLQRQERLRGVKQNQQEAVAGMKGYELYDRHEGNIMNHNMMNRPMQVDLGLHQQVNGFEQDAVIANKTVAGLRYAGLQDEADILDGLLRESLNRGDQAGFHDLTQQGASRLMKIKQIPSNIGSYQQILPQEEMPF